MKKESYILITKNNTYGYYRTFLASDYNNLQMFIQVLVFNKHSNSQ